MAFTASDICKIILAIILPPLGVFLERGCGADLLINILLTILGYIPGIIHALYIILKYQVPPVDRSPRMHNLVIWQGIIEGIWQMAHEWMAGKTRRFQRNVSFAEWREARRTRKALDDLFGDVEANPAQQVIELGSSSGPEGAYEYEMAEINDQHQQEPVAPAQADLQQLPPQQDVESAIPSSAPTVVGDASPPKPPASPVNEAVEPMQGADGPGGLVSVLIGVLGGFGI